MMPHRFKSLAVIIAATLVCNSAASAQTPPPTQAAADAAAEDDKSWSFSASVYTFIVGEDDDYLSPIITADHGRLHLEARYNYEDIDTASAFIGCNFEFGDELSLELTPKIGIVGGESEGIAPGYHFTVSYKRFELYSEGEYLFNTEESSDSFFYAWTELSYSPVDWFRVGLALQRTRAYESDLDFQPGFLIGASYRMLDFTTYVFNLGFDEPTFVFALGVSF
jgi:hypothetical protein